MEPKDMTVEQLQEGNPDLVKQIRQSAIAEERARLDDIDALTLPGYEDMAAKAKADGTSAVDFQKSLVTAMKQKGTNFMQARQMETSPAKNVAGGAPSGAREDEQLEKDIKDIAKYAELYSGDGTSSMF